MCVIVTWVSTRRTLKCSPVYWVHGRYCSRCWTLCAAGTSPKDVCGYTESNRRAWECVVWWNRGDVCTVLLQDGWFCHESESLRIGEEILLGRFGCPEFFFIHSPLSLGHLSDRLIVKLHLGGLSALWVPHGPQICKHLCLLLWT